MSQSFRSLIREEGPHPTSLDSSTTSRSPWSTYPGRKRIVELSPPIQAVHGRLTVPGSKSLTNRALLISALAEGTSHLKGLLRSDDSYWCIRCLQKLGVELEVEEDTAVVRGTGGKWPVKQGELHVGYAGTVARFLPGALAISEGEWTVKGDHQIMERPSAPLWDALTALGAKIKHTGKKGSLPVRVAAQGLRGGQISMSGSLSSQFISGLLIAAPYMREGLTLNLDGDIVQEDYVRMTLEMMRVFGVSSEWLAEKKIIHVAPGRYRAAALTLEPDISTCGYFWALAALTQGTVRTDQITPAAQQPDLKLLDVLTRMGCRVTRDKHCVEVEGPAQLKGGFTLDMGKWSDQTLTMAVLAVHADQPITLRGASHIRHHECDRISAICSELGQLGIRTEEYPDGLTVYPGQVQVRKAVDPREDHRMAMALSLLGARTEGLRIQDPGCVSKTCPDYFAIMAGLGLQVRDVSEKDS
ncbi:3-phosphoshikimate 1-carboxyvinyltransferase [Paenibacillus senegalensis]|uniref:3-phosphoshikimate 1-carboxyvinyltransferase n=1 Tax=Paenibacillus senegalensis TaxID=1465766 RepID=UPI0002891C75|nr:3-phosphoshikimate 1-carboxyvinyltransferase [Paenibacillus senegalensis]